ncbi:MAG: HD domain-containing phosphohydrolase [Planctomycetaceae bacterium]
MIATMTELVAAPPSVPWDRTADESSCAGFRRDLVQGKIAIIDDEPLNVMTLGKHLKIAGMTDIVSTSDATAAFDLLLSARPDLVLLDVMMPVVTGIDVLRRARSDTRLQHLPVLILTASSDQEIKQSCLELGATDFLTKPIDPIDLIPRVRNALVTKHYHDQLARHALHLQEEVRKRTAELAASRAEVVHCLARVAEFRDDVTGNHIRRVGRYVGILARQLGFTDQEAETFELAAQLHDIGKVGIPDEILKKAGPLDPEEFDLMKTHCALAKTVIQPLDARRTAILRKHGLIGSELLDVSSSPLLLTAARIAQTHHEWWNGAGYPFGLKGDDIPIEGRITAVADVYDALSSKRPYKAAMPREKCFDILQKESGTHFDPQVLDAFFACQHEIIDAQLELQDVSS